MTVEEKAPYLDKANKYWNLNANIIGLYSKENELAVKNAYIDGMADGEPKWHDLRKNPNDLPKDDRECLCFTSNCYFVGYYDEEYDQEWHFDEFCTNTIIAWCELPKFDDEVLNIKQTTGEYLLNRIKESILSSSKEGLRVSKIYLTIKTYKEISFYIETKINTYIQRDPKEDPRKNFTLFGNKCEVSDYDDFGNLVTNDYLIIYE